MLQGVANAKLQTADQWNYWYGQITGVHQTAELFVGNRVTEVISASVYLARRHTAGLKGLIW
jgi:hypothetical protein